MGDAGRIAAAVIGGIVALSGVSTIILAATMTPTVTSYGSYTIYTYPIRDVMYVIGGIMLVGGGIPCVWGISGLVGGGKKPSAKAPVVRSAVRTSKGTDIWAESFTCGKCGMELTAYKVKVKGLSAKVKAICPSKHKWEFLLPMPQQAEWIDALAKHIFRCKKCGAELLYPEKLGHDEDGYITYKLRCPACGSDHRYVKMILQNAVEDARQQLAAPSKLRVKTRDVTERDVTEAVYKYIVKAKGEVDIDEAVEELGITKGQFNEAVKLLTKEGRLEES